MTWRCLSNHIDNHIHVVCFSCCYASDCRKIWKWKNHKNYDSLWSREKNGADRISGVTFERENSNVNAWLIESEKNWQFDEDECIIFVFFESPVEWKNIYNYLMLLRVSIRIMMNVVFVCTDQRCMWSETFSHININKHKNLSLMDACLRMCCWLERRCGPLRCALMSLMYMYIQAYPHYFVEEGRCLHCISFPFGICFY